MPLSVAIVEDDPRLTADFVDLINREADMICTATYESAESALVSLPALMPDAVLMDINLPGITGIECTRRLRSAVPSLCVVMLTTFDDSERVFESLKAGASGYLLKRAASEEIVRAIRDVCAGGAPMSGAIARKVIQFFSQNQAAAEVQALTERERAVLDALSGGQQYKEIADSLSISINTVRKHIRVIYEKLHVNTRADAVRKLGRV